MVSCHPWFPPTVDFAEPRAFVRVRQAMIRWTWKPSERLLWAVALEERRPELLSPPETENTTRTETDHANP